MHSVGFEPTITAFERVKTFHTSDLAVTVFGLTVDVATTNKQGTYLLKLHESTLVKYQSR
jgi:hypothetical protein